MPIELVSSRGGPSAGAAAQAEAATKNNQHRALATSDRNSMGHLREGTSWVGMDGRNDGYFDRSTRPPQHRVQVSMWPHVQKDAK